MMVQIRLLNIGLALAVALKRVRAIEELQILLKVFEIVRAKCSSYIHEWDQVLLCRRFSEGFDDVGMLSEIENFDKVRAQVADHRAMTMGLCFRSSLSQLWTVK